MKKLIALISGVLALNFLALAGGVGYLFKTGKIDKEKALAIKDMILAPATQPAATQPVAEDGATTRPTLRLEELLAKRSGMTTAEQVDFLQRTFDAQNVLLDRRRSELDDLQRQIDIAKEQVAKDRAKVTEDTKKLVAQRDEAKKLETDQGFQDSLAMYQAMPGKQVKTLFMGLDDDTVVRYLQAMGPAGAKKILKEFKSVEELTRVASIMEKMRQADASAATSGTTTNDQSTPTVR